MRSLFTKGASLGFAAVIATALGLGAWGALSPMAAGDQYCYYTAGCHDNGTCNLSCGPLHGGCTDYVTPGFGLDCFCECHHET